MSRREPAVKLPLSQRKDVREQFDAKKADLEAALSSVLGGQAWTVDINALAIFPYSGGTGYAWDRPGRMIYEYVDSAISSIKHYRERHGENVIQELNDLCSAHSVTMDVDLDGKFSYSGVKISDKGELVILFNENHLGTNIPYALEPDNLTEAINTAPTKGSHQKLSFKARQSIERDYTGQVDDVRSKVSAILGINVTFEPNFENTYEKLRDASLLDKSENSIGAYTRDYFESIATVLKYRNVENDEMVREAFHEEMTAKKVAFRLLEAKSIKKGYAEAIFEDGVLFIQTDTNNWGTNISSAADRILDEL